MFFNFNLVRITRWLKWLSFIDCGVRNGIDAHSNCFQCSYCQYNCSNSDSTIKQGECLNTSNSMLVAFINIICFICWLRYFNGSILLYFSFVLTRYTWSLPQHMRVPLRLYSQFLLPPTRLHMKCLESRHLICSKPVGWWIY